MFTFINLDNENNRKRAFEIVEKIKSYKALVIEPINIDADKAHEVIKNIEFNIELLNGFVGNDKPKRDTSFYYNWLEEDD